MRRFENAGFGKLQLQDFQKIFYAGAVFDCLLKRQIKQHKIVHIPRIALYFQRALDKMVQRIQVNQGIQLAQQVADRYPDGLAMVGKPHHRIDKLVILDMLFKQLPQHTPVNSVKEFANVELQDIAVGGRLLHSGLRVIRRFVRPFSLSASKRLVDELAIKKRVRYAVNRVLNNKITKGRRVYFSWLWLVHHKAVVRQRLVFPTMDFTVQILQV